MLPHFLPAGDVNGLTGHIAGFIGGQEHHDIGDVLILAASPEGYLVEIFLAHFRLGDALVGGILLEIRKQSVTIQGEGHEKNT